MATYYQYTPGQLNADELAKLHALPDDALLTAQEAAEVLRIKYTTLAWYRRKRTRALSATTPH